MTDEQALQVDDLRKRVDSLLDEIHDGQWQLGKKVVQLGNALLEVRRTKSWEQWGFSSFGAYIKSLRERVDAGKTSLYGYIGIVEKLLPVVGEEQVTQMGVTRAGELAKAIRATGRNPSPEILEKAQNPEISAKEFKAEIAQEFHFNPLEDEGTWWDVLGGFYVTTDEKKEFERGMFIAMHVDPPIDLKLPEHVIKKEIIRRFVQEFTGTHAAEVKA